MFLIKGIGLVFNNKKNIKPEFFTIKNLFAEINTTMFSCLKFFNIILNHGNNKRNYRYIKRLKYISAI